MGGGVVTATDPNVNDDVVSYKLGGPDASSFDIDLTTGQIMVGAGAKLDYETKTSYMVKVIATDSFGATASIDVTITVTDVNEGPEITGSAQEEYPENGTGRVARFTAVDPEGAGAITWSLAELAATLRPLRSIRPAACSRSQKCPTTRCRPTGTRTTSIS